MNIKYTFLRFCLLFTLVSPTLFAQISTEISLNGTWETGVNRQYDNIAYVPGLGADPKKMQEGMLWYKRRVALPRGKWTRATLMLNGARFNPVVFVNGEMVSESEGGMAPTVLPLKHAAIKPGNEVTLEIGLKSLQDVKKQDASRIPAADHWRSNISSGLWDKVTLTLHGENRISRVIPFSDFQKQKLTVHWEIEKLGKSKASEVLCELLDNKKRVVAQAKTKVKHLRDTTLLNLNGHVKPWSPEQPNLYTLRISLKKGKKVWDVQNLSYGLKSFATADKGFRLNGQPFTARAATVVWHRWVRDKEVRELAFDTAWFHKNIVQRLKDHGGNTLRFHLGTPPEAFLDLCDRYGLAVQYEWLFFHGMEASKASLEKQWRSWLDLAMRHPSVCLIHPWNETEGEQLKTAWSAIDTIKAEYPALVMAERDVLHIHKYWWSLFENLGLYYDKAEQFPLPIMADEFGGNYLDGQGNWGGYKTLKESYMRFLGRNHTPAQRLQHHTVSNTQVAEYWRRIGAAGFSPFCALGSWEDGNHWFMGKLLQGNPKPVWAAMTAAYAPQSVSLEVWDRNFTPAQNVTLPLYFFNETAQAANLSATVYIADSLKNKIAVQKVQAQVAAFGRVVNHITLTLPEKQGNYSFLAELDNQQANIKYPVVSQWAFQVLKPAAPAEILSLKVGIAPNEAELKAFLKTNKIKTVDINDTTANLILTSRPTWDTIAANNAKLLTFLDKAIKRGTSVVILDAGPRPLGQGYPNDSTNLGPLQGVAQLKDAKTDTVRLFGGIKLLFTEVAEPESHIHPSATNAQLWENMKPNYTWLWNGLRGGLNAPATDMEPIGLKPAALIAQWASRGADANRMRSGAYYAFNLQGFYAFSDKQNDRDVITALKDKVKFLVDDAPALKDAINPDAPVSASNLAKAYQESANGQAEMLTPLASCGKNLTRTPVVQIDFGKQKGKLIVSQLLTAGRLAQGFGQNGLYGLRYDPAAVQMVLNMLKAAK